MRYLTLGEVVALHRAILAATGGADGIRELGALESALAQPKATFDGTDLFPSVVDKASALAFGLAMNQLGEPFLPTIGLRSAVQEAVDHPRLVLPPSSPH